MRRRPDIAHLWLVASLCLTGCAVGPRYHTPAMASPSAWLPSKDRTAPSLLVDAAPDVEWWRVFHDAELTSLESRVTRFNLDVARATERIAQSRASLRMAGADRLPSLDADAAYSRQQYSSKELEHLVGAVAPSAQGAVGQQVTASSGRLVIPPLNSWQDGLDLNWEVDLWGRVRRQYEAAAANRAAMEEERRGILIAAMAELAHDYLRLRAEQARLALLRQQVDTSRAIEQLDRDRFDGGIDSDVETASAASARSDAEARIPLSNQAIIEDVNAISILLGLAPRALADELLVPSPLPVLPPQVPIGILSTLAAQRPDIREADARLHAATAQTGEAEAEFYPKVTLSAGFGFKSFSFRDLSFWSARAWNVGPTITLPIFEGGRLHGQLDLRKAEQKEAALQYRETVLGAWRDVDNALTGFDEQQGHHTDLVRRADQATAAEHLLDVRFRHGEIRQDAVLQLRQARIVARLSLADSNVAQNDMLVQLYSALGGGWTKTAETPSAD